MYGIVVFKHGELIEVGFYRYGVMKTERRSGHRVSDERVSRVLGPIMHERPSVT